MAEENQQTTEENQPQEQEQNQAETVSKADYDAIVSERDNLLQYKPHEVTEEEKIMQEKQENLWQKEIDLTLKDNDLEQFKDVIKVNDEDELKEVVKGLSQIVNDIKVSTGYVPKDHAVDDEYSKHEKDGNTQGMIATKLANLFK